MSMTVEAIQKRLSAMPAAMAAKGLREPDAMYWVNANAHSHVSFQWKLNKPDRWGSKSHFESVRGDTPAEILANADAFVAALAAPAEARQQEFMEALGAVIELGRENGIDVDFVNPLITTMKRLSENAITDQREAA